MLFATSHNFILVGSFTALLYVVALFLFRKGENISKDNEKELHHKVLVNQKQFLG